MEVRSASSGPARALTLLAGPFTAATPENVKQDVRGAYEAPRPTWDRDERTDMRPTPTITAAEATWGVTDAAAGRPAGSPALRNQLLYGDDPVDYLRHVEGTDGEVLVMGSMSEQYRVHAAELTVRVA